MCVCVLAWLIYNALKSNTRTVLKMGRWWAVGVAVGGGVSGYWLESLVFRIRIRVRIRSRQTCVKRRVSAL